jgi:hypothetical protein
MLPELFTLAALDPETQDRIESITTAYLQDVITLLEDINPSITYAQTAEIALQSVQESTLWV